MHTRIYIRCHRTLQDHQVTLVLAQRSADLMSRPFHVLKIVSPRFERGRSDRYEYSLSSFECFLYIRSEVEVSVGGGATQNLVEPRFVDGTSACSQCFHHFRIFVDARYAIAHGSKHGSAYEANVPGAHDSQVFHRSSNLAQVWPLGVVSPCP